MRILFVAPKVPRRASNGEQLRSYHFIREMSNKGHKIDLVCFSRPEDGDMPDYDLRDMCNKLLCVKWSSSKAKMNRIGALFSHTPFMMNHFVNRSMNKILARQVRKTTYDLVHVSTVRMGAYLPIFKDLTVVLDYVDGLSLNVERRKKYERNFFSRIGLRIEAKRMKAYEEKLGELNISEIVSSQLEAESINRDRVRIIGLGVNSVAFAPNNSAKPVDLMFTGNMNDFSNRDAVKYFVREVLPLIWEERPETDFWIVGTDPGADIRRLHDGKHVVVTGRVPQISDSLNTAKVFVAPVRAGNGIQFKVLQAMSCGLPVVCTPLANAGIGAKDGREIYETDDRALFAKTTLKLLEKPPLRKSMGDKARKLTQDCFTWAAVAESLESLYFGETIIAIVDATKTNESQPKVKIVKRGEEDLINNTPF